jgi:hypothetical protein
MTAKHTPGPWTVPVPRIGPNQAFRVMAGSCQIADTIEDNGAVDAQANARLIAAAPEMAKALQAIVAGGITGWSLAKHNAARAALEKAGVPLD